MSYCRYFIFCILIFQFLSCFSQQKIQSLPVTSADSIFGGAKQYGWNNLDFSVAGLPLKMFDKKIWSEGGINAQSTVSSNSVNLLFSSAALRNQFLDEQKKSEVSKHLQSMNVFEFNLSGELFYRFVTDTFLFKSPSLISFTLRTGSVQQVKFTDDLFNIVFFGNANFAGRTADFSGTKFLSYNYNQLRLGIQKKLFVSGNGSWEAGLGLSFLTAKYGSGVTLDQATLFTEQYGSYIDAGYRFNYFVADSSNSGRWQVDGIGGSVDAMASYISLNRKNRFEFYVNDLGFITWNKRTRIYSADSSLHFEGIEVTNFLLSNDSAFFQFNTDTLLNKTGTDVKTEKYNTSLPIRFSFVFTKFLTERWSASAGMSYRPFPDLLPMIFIQPEYSFTHSFSSGLLFSYGGTDGFQTGLQVSGIIKRRLFLRIGSQNVLGIFLPKQTTSTSLFLQSSVRF